jgi:predicted ribosomally synthesized peptide with SipW-like signal peptide
MSKRTRKMLLSLMVIGAIGSVVGWGVFAAFTATTTNTGNTITAGTVNIAQHAGSTTLYSASNQGPGASTVGCLRVTYTGSLASSVKLYTPSTVTNGTAFNLVVERGSGLSSPDNTMNCTGFSSSSTAYSGTLGGFATTYAGGLDGKAGGSAWATSDAVDYRFTITVVDDPTPGAHTSALSSSAHTFTWEARNN